MIRLWYLNIITGYDKRVGKNWKVNNLHVMVASLKQIIFLNSKITFPLE